MIKPTPQDIAWLKQQIDDEESKAQQQEPSFLSKAADFADKYINKPVQAARLPSLAGGFLSGTENAIASAANLPLEGINKIAGTNLKVPYTDPSPYLPQDPLSRMTQEIGNVGGQIAPSALLFTKILGAMGKQNLAKDIAAAATTGAITGGSDNNDIASRLTSAAVGGALPATAGLLSKPMANRISNITSSLKSAANDEYSSIFNSLKDSGLHTSLLRVPGDLAAKDTTPEFKNLIEKLSSSKSNDVTKSLDKFKNNPTFQNAHDAQSALGKGVSKMQSSVISNTKKGLPSYPADKDAIDYANDLKNRIRGSMQQFLVNNDKGDILKQYSSATKKYASDVSPFLKPEISQYQDKDISARELIKSLQKNPDFLKRGAKNVPGFMLRKNIDLVADPVRKMLPLGTAAGIGAGAAYNLGFPGIGYLINKIKNS